MTLADFRRSLSARTAIALAIALVCSLAFLHLAGEALEGSTPSLDVTFSRWLRGHASPGLDRVMAAFTTIGSYAFVGCVVAAVAAWARWRGARALAGELLAVPLAAVTLNAVLKHSFRRPRPDLFPEAVLPETWSFPSGHSMVSLTAYLTVAFVFAAFYPRLRVPAYAVALLVAALVGLSRIYLGVHWPTDVAAGYAAAGILLVAARIAIGRMRGDHPRGA